MQDFLAKFRVGTWIVHGLMAMVLLVLFAKFRMMAGWCIFPGLLIACGSTAALPGRPLTLYAAFGALLGISFWWAVSAINQGGYLELIPVLMVVVGASWLLHETDWPSAIFTIAAIALELGLVALVYANRHDILDVEPEHVMKSLATRTVMLLVGATYTIVGFAEVLLLEKARWMKKSRAVRTPARPPMIDL
jgi:hypothetical protein